MYPQPPGKYPKLMELLYLDPRVKKDGLRELTYSPSEGRVRWLYVDLD